MEQLHNETIGDETLLAQAAGGDEEAFEMLVKRHQEGVINLAYRYAHNAADAEDMAADVFFRVWKYAADFKGKSAFSTWLYRIAVNVCLNYRKAAGARPATEPLDKPVATEDGEFTREFPEPDHARPDQAALTAERNATINEAVNKLVPQQKMAFVLSWFEGRSYSEIAELMQVTVPAVESLIFRAKENLRKQLSSFTK